MQEPSGLSTAILLVEDDPTEVRLIQEALIGVSVPIHLHVVRGSREALAFLQHEAPYQHAPRPAFILLSLKLPGMSGQQLLGALKRDPALQTIPAIVFTNSMSPLDIRQSYELGANSYIMKPFGFTELVEVMHAIVVYWIKVVTQARPSTPRRQ
jgi:two-component system, chemotaxis family, response regulator Rcp1